MDDGIGELPREFILGGGDRHLADEAEDLEERASGSRIHGSEICHRSEMLRKPRSHLETTTTTTTRMFIVVGPALATITITITITISINISIAMTIDIGISMVEVEVAAYIMVLGSWWGEEVEEEGG